jgi:uncharacterized protein with HEPN domain
MAERDDTVYLRHILDAIARIEEYLDAVWSTAKKDIPILKTEIQQILEIS